VSFIPGIGRKEIGTRNTEIPLFFFNDMHSAAVKEMYLVLKVHIKRFTTSFSNKNFRSTMLAEHIIYSAAIAIIAGMVFYRYTGRDPSWIIILCSWAPDIDMITNRVLTRFGFTLLFEGHRITHGDFHNIAAMIIFGIAVAFIVSPLGMKFFDSLVFGIIGFGAHLFEDALVYNPGYKFLWPLSSKVLGFGLLPNMISEENYFSNFFGIANTEVLVIGLMFLLIAIVIRTYFEGVMDPVVCSGMAVSNRAS
jgi:membrane-bound metal-dependent hydrolase YbcI (DUF457 family)